MSPDERYLHDPLHFRLENSIIPAHPLCATMSDVLFKHAPIPADFMPPSLPPGGRQKSLSERYTEPFWQASVTTMKARSPFSTSCGFVGIVPPEIRRGDAVAILFGADVPVILRPAGGGPIRLLAIAMSMGLCKGDDFSFRSVWRKVERTTFAKL